MVVFWILATLMIAVALAFVLVPLLRARPIASPSATEANLEVLRAHRTEIEADIATGTLPADAREEALAELVGRAAEDLSPAAPSAAAAPARRSWVPAAVAGVALPALAFGLYAVLGNPGAADPARLQAQASPIMSDTQIVEMVESLARKVKDRPDDIQGWSLLARSMAALERFPEAAEAYAHLAKLAPGDAQVLADYADALGMAQGRTLAGRPFELVKEALKADPKHKKALALAGTAALDAGDFAAATGYWQRLAAELPPESPDAAQVQAVLAEIRSRAGGAGQALPAPAAPVAKAPAAKPGPAPEATAAAPGAKTVSGSVALAPEVAGKVSGNETLFIFARADGGPRVPLAVIRATARELPMKFALDDTQAMSPEMKLSGAQAVRIEARISRSGNALPQPGDLVGSSAVVRPGARDVNIVVDKVLP